MEAWLVNKDFANYWVAARLVLSGQAFDLFADHATYFRHLTAAFGPDYPWRNWSYPPHYLLLIWPVGLFGYIPALAGFLAASLVAYLAAIRSFLGRVSVGPATVVALLLPSMIGNIDAAQNGFLTGALMLGGLALRDRRPVLAGILIGCLTIKPQLGVLVPLLLLYERKWTVIAIAALATVGMIGLSGMLFGWESWQGYLTQTLPYQTGVMTERFGAFLGMMPTIFGTLRAFGVSSDTALALHLAVAVPALGAAGWVLWHCRDAGLRAAVTIMTTLVVTPYWLSYDYGIAGGALLLAYGHVAGAAPTELRQRATLGIAAFTPVVAIPLWLHDLPLAPLPVFLGFGAVLRIAANSAARRVDDRT